MMTNQLKDDARIWQLIREAATKDTDYDVRKALELLVSRRGEDPTTWQLIREAATKNRHAYVRRDALASLARGQREDPATWQLIREAAITDPDKDVRSWACGLLLDVSNCDELQRKLMWQNLDEAWRGKYDPKEPITSQRIAYVAQKLGLSIDEVQRQYEAIADRLRIELYLEWRKPS